MPRMASPEALRDERLERWVGFYLVRWSLKGPQVPAMIEVCNHEPGDPSNLMDRTYFIAVFAGEECDPYEVVACKEHIEITRAEYEFRVADRAWAREHAPADPAAVHARRRVDLTTMAPIEP